MKTRKYIPLSKLPLSEDFMFGQVMRQKDICKLFLEALLNKEIKDIVFIEKQLDLSDSYIAHGVRLDVYLNDAAGTIYNIEMQNVKNDDLARRSRYYQSAIDRNVLEKGQSYRDMADSYVVFVCDFDYFGRGLAIYEKQSVIKDTQDSFVDGSHALILNSQYSKANATPAILEYLSYIRENNDHSDFQSELMEKVVKEVDSVRHDKKKEVAYMTYVAKMNDVWHEGLTEGTEKTTVSAIRNLMSNMDLSLERAMSVLAIPEVEREKYKNLVENSSQKED